MTLTPDGASPHPMPARWPHDRFAGSGYALWSMSVPGPRLCLSFSRVSPVLSVREHLVLCFGAKFQLADGILVSIGRRGINHALNRPGFLGGS